MSNNYKDFKSISDLILIEKIRKIIKEYAILWDKVKISKLQWFIFNLNVFFVIGFNLIL